jgi:hypothetical protein
VPLLVIVDPLAFSRGWLGSAQRYFQVAKALQELGWGVAVVARRDYSCAAKEVDMAFPGQVFRTPFGTVPVLMSPWGLRHAWWLTRQWTGRPSGEDVWAARLTRWTKRHKPPSPLASADLLCAVTYHYWGTPGAARTMAQELEVPYWLDIQDPLVGTIGSRQTMLSDDQLLCLRDAKQIVTTTDTYTEHLRKTLPESADKARCLRLTQNTSAAIATYAAPPDGRLVLLHAGYLNGQPNRSAIPVLDAMARLYEEAPLTRGKVTLRLVGEGHGIREAIARANKLGLRQDLECQPQVSPKALQRQLDTADVLCILKAAVTRRDFQIPGKTYDYLFSNKPILAVTFPGELAAIIEETGSGFAVAPDDTGRVAEIIEQLLRQKAATGSVSLERNIEKLSPYAFDTFRQRLEAVLAACASVGDTASQSQD